MSEPESAYASQYYQFKIIKKSDGNYLIAPRALESENKVLSILIMGAGNYVAPEIKTANSPGNGWKLLKINTAQIGDEQYASYPVSVTVLYDEGYNRRYDDAAARVEDHLIKSQEYYLTHFRIVLDFQFADEDSMFESFADVCTNTNCQHDDRENGGVCHGDASAIHSDVVTQTSGCNTDFVLAFIGHDLCRTKLIGDVETHYNSIIGMRSGTVCIVEYMGVDVELNTVIHELGHFFGAPDHYGQNGISNTASINDSEDTKLYNRMCIYGEDKSAAEVKGHIMCAGCQYRIAQYLS